MECPHSQYNVLELEDKVTVFCSVVSQLNIRGLLSKIDELKTILDECNFDIMGVCETFIDSNVAGNEISIDGYSIVKKDRNRHGGGVLLYVKDGIDY